MSELHAGEALPPQTYRVTRADLVRYAEASGDHNPIHQSEEVAREVGLPGVIAHGMYTMALAARALDTWAGATGRIRELGCKFTRPVVVPAGDEGVEVTIRGTVQNVSADGIHVALEATCGDQKVLGMPRAVLARD